MLSVENTSLPDVLHIKLDFFEDHRGEYVETYNKDIYKESGIDIEFVQDDYSISSKHVLRGIHGDSKTWKLVSCPYGKLYFVVVNCDTTSDYFGKWESFILSDVTKNQILVPPKYGNGHLVLSERAIFSYKQSTHYDPVSQFTYRYDDDKLNIWWPVKNPIISLRDESGNTKNVSK